MSRFDNLLSTLPEGAGKERIQTALNLCADISDEDYLRSIVAGNTKAETTALLQQAPLSLTLYDASALAGLLVAPTGIHIPISHLIIHQALTLFLYLPSHISITLFTLKSLYISHLISPTRLLLSVK